MASHIASVTRIGSRPVVRRRSFMAQPFKHPVSGIYYLRRKVPPELRAALGHEIKQSLKTRDPQEAKTRFAGAWTASEQLFKAARGASQGEAEITRQDALRLADIWQERELARLEAAGDFTARLIDGPSTSAEVGNLVVSEFTEYLSIEEAEAQGLDVSPADEADKIIPKALRNGGLPVPPSGSPAYALLRAAFADRVKELSAIAKHRHEGNWLPQPAASVSAASIEPKPSQAVAGAKVFKLTELFESYASEKKLNDGDTRATKRTIVEYRAVVDRFVALRGDLTMGQLTRDVFMEYRGQLASLPRQGTGIRALSPQQLIAKAQAEGLPTLGEATIRNQLRALSAVLGHGVRLGKLSENPIVSSGLSKAAAKAATKLAGKQRRIKEYTQEQLKVIFSSPIYSPGGWTSPNADFGQAWYWLPLLMYYTGARREELAQLTVSDVRTTDDVHHLNILSGDDEEDGHRTVKTESSRRIVPLHPDLVKLGLLTYANSLPQEGQLFPKLKVNKRGYHGANFGKRWASYLRDTVKLESSATPSHGFRHTFKTLSRAAGIPEDVQDAITGHASSNSVARNYGSMPLSVMYREVQKYPSAPGLRLLE